MQAAQLQSFLFTSFYSIAPSLRTTNSMTDAGHFTYQTRFEPDDSASALLDGYARLYGTVECSLFAAYQAKIPINDCKRLFLRRFGITARQFNAVRIGLDGKIAAIKARWPELIAEAQLRLSALRKRIAVLAKKRPGSLELHQKQRRHAVLVHRLTALQADQDSGAVRLCFGSRKLFHAQHHLEANGYESHGQWKADWQARRRSQFFVLGSADETASFQGCQAVLQGDGTFTLQLRLPDALADLGNYVVIPGIRFSYGHAAVLQALQSSRRVRSSTKEGRQIVKRIGSALSYRFIRDERGWRVMVSVVVLPVSAMTHRALGAIGVDVNADHLAISEVDRSGNWIGSRRIALCTYGKTTDQSKALIGDAAVNIVAQAKAAGKPIVIERLDFQRKKAALTKDDVRNARYARMLSSFACNTVASSIRSAAFRAGVEVIEVNPAFTSTIGAVDHAHRLGITVHQGAALVIARRGLGLSERPTVRGITVPTRNGDHVTFADPVRNRAKHVWAYWSVVRKRLIAAHEAHARSGASRTAPQPLSPDRLLAERSTWALPVRFRQANRQQHCSADVWSDVPF